LRTPATACAGCMTSGPDICNMPFVHMLEVPRNRNRNGVDYFTQRLRALKSDLETAFGVQVLDSELQKAVDGGNMRRKAMEALFDGQKTIPPQAFGSDLMAACLADTRGEPVPSALGAQTKHGTPRIGHGAGSGHTRPVPV
jgi:hypothetical protein